MVNLRVAVCRYSSDELNRHADRRGATPTAYCSIGGLLIVRCLQSIEMLSALFEPRLNKMFIYRDDRENDVAMFKALVLHESDYSHTFKRREEEGEKE
jgi:hypothetical protein